MSTNCIAFSSPLSEDHHHSQVDVDPYDLSHFLPAGTLVLPIAATNIHCFGHWHTFCAETESDLAKLMQPKHKSLMRGLRFLTSQKFLAATFFCSDFLMIRVYLIPFDLARVEGALRRRNETAILAPARKLLRDVFSNLYCDPESWQGRIHTHYSPMANHLMSSKLDRQSFVEIYNTLPSPVLRTFDHKYFSDVNSLTDAILRQSIVGLRTNLYSYQCRSVAFMAQQELHPGSSTDPLYVRVQGLDDRSFFVQPGTLEVLENSPMAIRTPGGILCEELGTGKTVIILALILATMDRLSTPKESILDPRPILTPLALHHFPSPQFRDALQKFMRGERRAENIASRIPSLTEILLHHARTHPPPSGVRQTAETFPVSHLWEAYEHNNPYYHHYEEDEDGRLEDLPLRASHDKALNGPRVMYLTSATLILVPTTLLHQWVNEINKHCDDRLAFLVVKDKQELPSAQAMASHFDLILMSHTRFTQEAKRMDVSGLHTWTPCRCPIPQASSVRVPRCTCGNVPTTSPLLQVRWKRLVIDEGHIASVKTLETNLMLLVKCISVQYKWIVTGTPTTNLMGLRFGEGSASSETTQSILKALQQKMLSGEKSGGSRVLDVNGLDSSNGKQEDSTSTSSIGAVVDNFELQYPDEDSQAHNETRRWTEQDRKDLVRLGNMLGNFLEVPQFAAKSSLFNSHVIAPLMSKSGPLPGSVRVLRQIMESVMIRHRVEDVESEVTLPPMQQETILLDMDPYAVMTYNTMQSSIVINAVDSERVGSDYLLHPDNVKELHQTIENMSQAMFWHVDDMLFSVDERLENADEYMKRSAEKLAEGKISQEDFDMLRKALEVSNAAACNTIWRALNMHPNIFSRVYNIPEPIYRAWSSGYLPDGLGHASDIHGSDPYFLMIPERLKNLRAYLIKKPLSSVSSIINYGITVAEEDRYRYQVNMDRALSGKSRNKQERKRSKGSPSKPGTTLTAVVKTNSFAKLVETQTKRKALEAADDGSSRIEVHNNLYSSSPMAGVELRNTTSAKLNYILNEVQLYASKSKFLIFSKSPLTLMYIAEALAVMGIQYKHTIQNLRALQHDVTTFETSEAYRVFLMELKHGARGLNLVSASRVIFCEPVWQADVEAQAIKRVHRIGQISPVSVKTLAIRNTHEEFILKRRDDLKRGRGSSSGKLPELADDLSMRDFIAHPIFLPNPEPPIVQLRYPLLPSVSSSTFNGVQENNVSSLVVDPSTGFSPSGSETSQPSTSSTAQGATTVRTIRIPAQKRKASEVPLSTGSTYITIRKRVSVQTAGAVDRPAELPSGSLQVLGASHEHSGDVVDGETQSQVKKARTVVRFASP
ncbi:SNF2 family N-terminal domain-containing protein [Irpex rosettiformis]|uniref:SNF2 family N-terminal domain-containing protein n=1 Tax=Irpex rosettiformis TaxID=378272 RepID=A0ACB8TWL3_9APHY|nr:SNF2 family N-terminal domain-containing protein [Irpex rosettiformis]